MAKLNLKKSKFSNFISSKGFYVALAICLLGTGATAWFAVDRTLTGVGDKQGGSPSTNFSSGAEVNQNVSDMPQSSASASSAPSASSSSEASKQSSEKSDSSQTQSTAQSTLYVLPITGGKVVNAYSAGERVKSKTLNEWRTHDGIDFEAQVSTPVKAVADGTVVSTSNDPLWGYTVEIDHGNGITSIYSSLGEKLNVKKGDKVEAAQVIGSVAESASIEISEVSHLHFGMKKDGKWVDPLATMGKSE